MANNWEIGTINISTQDGLCPIPGWTNGLFGIDWRPRNDEVGMAFVVTHMSTGWNLFSVLKNLEEVQAIADQLQGLIDWSGDDVKAIKKRVADCGVALLDFVTSHEGGDPSLCAAPPGHYGGKGLQ